ncbi:unnamed protein product [Chilo suppressalis]|uniref:Integral membrane protein 2 n=1 Tax=Chilo suppressalis TaxID=168631 RepID=A0ABN8BB67_CHISP|nr:hypothetical protein evm_008631 [Chilo suppressalis]CAH0405043.1 unnamed protein product [Chilo suppressalis]
MTVLTKSSDLLKKPEIINTPLVVGGTRYDEENLKPIVRPRTRVVVYRSRCSSALLGVVFFTTLLMLMGAILALVFFNESNRSPKPTRYRGYCTIPMEVSKVAQVQKEEPNEFRVPLRWSSESEMTVFTSNEDQAQGDYLNSLLERFDIDGNLEKISVINGGQNVEFIHDFSANATGIVDSQRCFVMELDPKAVLAPVEFVLHIESGEPFDVMRVRRRLRALLPAAEEMRHLSVTLAEQCRDRPTYRLQTDDENIIRKRSVDEPKQDYLHFAGKHLMEMSIENMGELLEYEKVHA